MKPLLFCVDNSCLISSRLDVNTTMVLL